MWITPPWMRSITDTSRLKSMVTHPCKQKLIYCFWCQSYCVLMLTLTLFLDIFLFLASRKFGTTRPFFFIQLPLPGPSFSFLEVVQKGICCFRIYFWTCSTIVLGVKNYPSACVSSCSDDLSLLLPWSWGCIIPRTNFRLTKYLFWQCQVFVEVYTVCRFMYHTSGMPIIC